MSLTKKIITVSTIIATSLTALLLILLLFEVNLFGNRNFNVIITLACLGIGGFFAINSINMLRKNKMIGLISLGLILASVVLVILSSWLSLDSGMYFDITLSLGLLSILFNIIVSSGLDLGKSKIVLQVIIYLIVAVTDIVASLAIFGALNLLDILAWFLSLVILSVVGVIILKVVAKKSLFDANDMSDNMIKISKSEYEMLKEKAKKYDEITNKQ